MKRLMLCFMLLLIATSVLADEMPKDETERLEFIKKKLEANPKDATSIEYLTNNPQFLNDHKDILKKNPDILVDNPKLAKVWYTKSSNVGVCGECDNKFFKKPGNLHKHPDAAIKYLRDIVGRPIEFGFVEGLFYDSENGFLTLGTSSVNLGGLSSNVIGVLVENEKFQLKFSDDSKVQVDDNVAITSVKENPDGSIELESPELPPGLRIELNGGQITVAEDGTITASEGVSIFWRENDEVTAEENGVTFKFTPEGLKATGKFFGRVTDKNGVLMELQARGGSSSLSYNGDFYSQDGFLKRGKRNPAGAAVVMQEMDGKFSSENGILDLKPYNGRHSSLYDKITNTNAKTTGKSLSVIQGKPSKDLIKTHPNYVAYDIDYVDAQGFYDVDQGNFNSQAKSPDARVGYTVPDGRVNVKAKGNLRFAKGDPNTGELVAWEGNSGSEITLYPGKDNVETVNIRGNVDGPLGKLKKGFVIDKGIYAVQDGLEVEFTRTNGKIESVMTPANLQRLAKAFDKSATVIVKDYMVIDYGDAKLGVNPDGIARMEKDGGTATLLSPGRISKSMGKRRPLVLSFEEDRKFMDPVRAQIQALQEEGVYQIDPKTGRVDLKDASLSDKLAVLDADRNGYEALLDVIEARLEQAREEGTETEGLEAMHNQFEFAVDEKLLQGTALVATDHLSDGNIDAAIAEFQDFISANLDKPIAESAVYLSTKAMLNYGAEGGSWEQKTQRAKNILGDMEATKQKMADLRGQMSGWLTSPSDEELMRLRHEMAEAELNLQRLEIEEQNLQASMNTQSEHFGRAETYLKLIQGTSPGLAHHATLGLMKMHSARGDYDGAIELFDEANIDNVPDELRGAFFMERANAHLYNGEVSEGAEYLHAAYGSNPGDPALKREVVRRQMQLLDAFQGAASSEHQQMTKAYNQLVESFEGGRVEIPSEAVPIFGPIIKATGHDTVGALYFGMDPITAAYNIGKSVGHTVKGAVTDTHGRAPDYSSAQEAAHGEEVKRLNRQADGIFVTRVLMQRSLTSADPMSMEDIEELRQEPAALAERIEDLYPDMDQSKLAEMLVRIDNAFANPDVEGLSQGSRMDYLQNYGNHDFYKEALGRIGWAGEEETWGSAVGRNALGLTEAVGQAMTGKNIALMFGPAATVRGVQVAEGLGALATTYSTTAARAAQSLNAVKNSEAVVGALQLSNRYLGTWTTAGLSFVGEQVAETALGAAVGYGVGKVAPEYADEAFFLATSFAGHGRFFGLTAANQKALTRNLARNVVEEAGNQGINLGSANARKLQDLIENMHKKGIDPHALSVDEYVSSIAKQLNIEAPGTIAIGCAAGQCLSNLKTVVRTAAKTAVDETEGAMKLKRAQEFFEQNNLAEDVARSGDDFFAPQAAHAAGVPSESAAGAVARNLVEPEVPGVSAGTRAELEAAFEEVDPTQAFFHTINLNKGTDPRPALENILRNKEIGAGGRLGATEFSKGFHMRSSNPVSITLKFDPSAKNLIDEAMIPGAAPSTPDMYYASWAPTGGRAESLDGLTHVIVRSQDAADFKLVRSQLDAAGLQNVKVVSQADYLAVATEWRALRGRALGDVFEDFSEETAEQLATLVDGAMTGGLTPREARNQLTKIKSQFDPASTRVLSEQTALSNAQGQLEVKVGMQILDDLETQHLKQKLQTMRRVLRQDEVDRDLLMREYQRALIGENVGSVPEAMSEYLSKEMAKQGVTPGALDEFLPSVDANLFGHGAAEAERKTLASEALFGRTLAENIDADISAPMFTSTQRETMRDMADSVLKQELDTDGALEAYARLMYGANDAQSAQIQHIMSPILESQGILRRADISQMTGMDSTALAQQLGLLDKFKSVANLQ